MQAASERSRVERDGVRPAPASAVIQNADGGFVGVQGVHPSVAGGPPSVPAQPIRRPCQSSSPRFFR